MHPGRENRRKQIRKTNKKNLQKKKKKTGTEQVRNRKKSIHVVVVEPQHLQLAKRQAIREGKANALAVSISHK
jgi:hypothetical protein